MSIEDIPPLLEALQTRLSEALAEAGFPPEEGGDPVPVPVHTSVVAETAELYVRIDQGALLMGNTKWGTSDRHPFNVRVVHVADSGRDEIRDAMTELARVGALVRGALRDWVPLDHAGKIQFLGGFPAEENTPETSSYVCRFEVYIHSHGD